MPPLTSSLLLDLSEYEMALAHTPVLLEELVDLLCPTRRGRLRCHVRRRRARRSRGRASRHGRLPDLCDRDPSVAEYYRELARRAKCETSLYFGNFADVLTDLDAASLNVVYMDLGVSSMQLDRRERGFSYAYDAPLDMRMDPSEGRNAADLVNELPADELKTNISPASARAVCAGDCARHSQGTGRSAPSLPASWSRW